MVTPSNIVYSAAALRRMWGLLYRRLTDIKVREWWRVVWVWLPGHRPTFVSKAEFKNHFVEWRREAAQALRVVLWATDSQRYTVHNDAKHNSYVVDVLPEAVTCTCEDYQNQFKFWGRGCCKHGYAVLGCLGFSSLSDYITCDQQSPPVPVAIAA